MYPTIAICGTMGSGKTTAASLLSEKLGIPLLTEQFAENAFLSRFYADMKKWSFHSQTFFLTEKITQLLKVNALIQHQSLILDTPIEQDVFSYAQAHYTLGNMEQAEWQLYQKIYELNLRQLPIVSILIYLKTSIDVVIDRINNRGRLFEQKISPEYLQLLEKLNEVWMSRLDHTKTKLITIKTDRINLVTNEHDKMAFVAKIKKQLPS